MNVSFAHRGFQNQHQSPHIRCTYISLRSATSRLVSLIHPVRLPLCLCRHFLKWDIAVPSTPPSHSVTAYCTALKFPVRVERPLATSPSSARLNVSAKNGPERASSISALRTERSSSTLAHQASSHFGQSDKHDSNNSTKMINGAPPS